ncbi:MAG: 2-oxoacid:acceptor oxidoreductase family protein, partial [Spirochaetota bacterium]
METCFNIYMTGVGGQGIGLLAEILARAADYAGLAVRGCDTHGLAQRGGMVTSHLRLGHSWSPLIPDGGADLVVALERHEAVRAVDSMLKPGGTMIWYDTSLQPLDVRMGLVPALDADVIQQVAEARGIRAIRVYLDDLPDSRMQNIALVSGILSNELIPGLGKAQVRKAMKDLMTGAVLEANLEIGRAH